MHDLQYPNERLSSSNNLTFCTSGKRGQSEYDGVAENMLLFDIIVRINHYSIPNAVTVEK